MSAIQSWFGWSAVKRRSTRSAGEGEAAAMVVLACLPRRSPCRPFWRISRSTVQRATRIPARLSCACTFRAP